MPKTEIFLLNRRELSCLNNLIGKSSGYNISIDEFYNLANRGLITTRINKFGGLIVDKITFKGLWIIFLWNEKQNEHRTN